MVQRGRVFKRDIWMSANERTERKSECNPKEKEMRSVLKDS